MPERITPEQRSRNMSRIRGRDTGPEWIVRRLLHRLGYRFRLHRKDLPGKPDIVLPKYRVVVFVHGCFWHSHPGCPRSTRPVQNREFWDAKLDRNSDRDQENRENLEALGWKVIVIWQCELRDQKALTAEFGRLLPKEPSV